MLLYAQFTVVHLRSFLRWLQSSRAKLEAPPGGNLDGLLLTRLEPHPEESHSPESEVSDARGSCGYASLLAQPRWMCDVRCATHKEGTQRREFHFGSVCLFHPNRTFYRSNSKRSHKSPTTPFMRITWRRSRALPRANTGDFMGGRGLFKHFTTVHPPLRRHPPPTGPYMCMTGTRPPVFHALHDQASSSVSLT